MKIYAHRTARGLIAENTLEGCALCLQLGVDYVDLDICMTKDGILVVSHDPILNKEITRDENGEYIREDIAISTLTFQELQRFNVGKINPTSLYASYFPDQQEVKGAKIPSLREALDLMKDSSVEYQIEMKTEMIPHAAFVEAVNHLLFETKSVERTEVQTFDLNALRLLHPLLKTSYVTKGKLFSKEWKTECWSVYEMDVTQAEIEKAQAHGVKVIAWGYPEEEGTEFNADQIKKLIHFGIDGIITDRPDKLLNFKNCLINKDTHHTLPPPFSPPE